MPFQRRRREVLQLAAACALGTSMRPAQACEFVLETLRITHPWSRATEAGADSAVLGMRIDQVTHADRLLDASTPVATGVELAGARGQPLNLEILPGQELEFSESGVHLRLTGLKAPLHTGRDYPLRLVFERGGVVEARLIVDQAVLPGFRFL